MAGSLPAETHVDSTSIERISLNGEWKFRFDDSDTGTQEKWYQHTEFIKEWGKLQVPGVWDLHHPDGFNKQTIAWYATTFKTNASQELMKLVFEGVFREARVWLNGKELGTNKLPYLPFGFNLQGFLKPSGENHLMIRIDNRLTLKTLPCDTKFNDGKHGWFPYGGIMRNVYIEATPPNYPAQLKVEANAKGNFKANLLFEELQGSSASFKVEVLSPSREVLASQTISNAKRSRYLYTAQVDNPLLWSPENPDNIYRLRISNFEEEQDFWEYEFAFKDFDIVDGRFLLNGKDIFLRGINRHEDDPVDGSVYNAQTMQTDLALLKEMNVNFIRPGHYPNDVRTLKALERTGIMIAEEIPVYQLSPKQLKDTMLQSLAQQALERMIIRDGNRPGIVMWSLANEVHFWGKHCRNFYQPLQDIVEELSPEKETMIARLSLPRSMDALLGDKSSDVVDVIGINIYFGWYIKREKHAKKFIERIHRKFPEQAIILSEYGAGAQYGNHVTELEKKENNKDHSYSEEFQYRFHSRYLDIVKELEYVRGTMPWAFADFRMQWTVGTGKPHPVPLTNLKGLVSGKREKKAAFELYRQFYLGKR